MGFKSKKIIVLAIIVIFVFSIMAIDYKYDTESNIKIVTEQAKLYNKWSISNEVSDKPEKESIETNLVNLGTFKLTAYCSCSKCCGKWAYNRPNGIVYGAIGEELKEGYSIAVDPDIIPYRTEVIINGHAYKAQDCGGAIKGNRIDVYFNNHDDALEFGVQYAEVFVESE